MILYEACTMDSDPPWQSSKAANAVVNLEPEKHAFVQKKLSQRNVVHLALEIVYISGKSQRQKSATEVV